MKDTEKWYGSTMETEQQKLLDPASGEKIILRRVEHRYPPGLQKKPKKKDLLTPAYIKHMENLLWADNLELIMFPKVTFNKRGFDIFFPCKPKKGNMIPSLFADTLSAPLHTRLQGEEKDNG